MKKSNKLIKGLCIFSTVVILSSSIAIQKNVISNKTIKNISLNNSSYSENINNETIVKRGSEINELCRYLDDIKNVYDKNNYQSDILNFKGYNDYVLEEIKNGTSEEDIMIKLINLIHRYSTELEFEKGIKMSFVSRRTMLENYGLEEKIEVNRRIEFNQLCRYLGDIKDVYFKLGYHATLLNFQGYYDYVSEEVKNGVSEEDVMLYLINLIDECKIDLEKRGVILPFDSKETMIEDYKLTNLVYAKKLSSYDN